MARAPKVVVDDTDRPHYRALAELYLDRIIDEGGEFHSDEVPGMKWEPLNEAAELAIMARDEAKRNAEPTLAERTEAARLAYEDLRGQSPV